MSRVGVRYIIDDVPAAVEFYTTVLGFSVERDASPAFASVVRDGVRLLLSGDGSSGKRPLPDGREQEPGGWNRLHVEVDDLEGEVALKRLDVRVRLHEGILHRVRRLVAEAIQRGDHSLRTLRHGEERAQRAALERLGSGPQPVQIRVRQDGLVQADSPGVLRRLRQQVRTGPEVRNERHHQLLADRIDRRVGDLGEELLEVVVEEPRLVGKYHHLLSF